MKYLKATPTVVVKGIFRKRYYLVLPSLHEFGVYELPVIPVKDQTHVKTKDTVQPK